RRRSASSGRSRSTTPASPHARATSTTRRRRSARSSSARRRRTDSRSPSTAGRPMQGCTPRRDAPRSLPRVARSRRCGSVGSAATAGSVGGGPAPNIVPEWCSLVGEARSHDERKLAELVQEMQDAVTFAAGLAECHVETKVTRQYRAYRFRRGDLPIRLAADALGRCGFEPSYTLSGGAADANVFNERGLQCVNLANGMAEIHTPDEHIAVADLEAMVEVTLALLEAAASSSSGNGANASVHQGN